MPERADAETPRLCQGVSEQVDPEASRAARAAWARLIKKVYEVIYRALFHAARGHARYVWP